MGRADATPAHFSAAPAARFEMKSYLLDTNVVSELRKPKPHGAVLAWLRPLRDEQIYLSAVTLGELQAGVERLRPQDRMKASEIETWIDHLSASSQILPMGTVCFREWARLMEGMPDHLLEDVMIAATARVHQLTVATRNERDFARLRVEIVNPFKLKA
jgi:predicted nucleic acid-binding protein